TLDALLAAKEKIEEALYQRVRDLFSLKVDLVFYDLTSSTQNCIRNKCCQDFWHTRYKELTVLSSTCSTRHNAGLLHSRYEARVHIRWRF
ncbi:unnamed protein product, partial [marine sediment metagenome]